MKNNKGIVLVIVCLVMSFGGLATWCFTHGVVVFTPTCTSIMHDTSSLLYGGIFAIVATFASIFAGIAAKQKWRGAIRSSAYMALGYLLALTVLQRFFPLENDWYVTFVIFVFPMIISFLKTE